LKKLAAAITSRGPRLPEGDGFSFRKTERTEDFMDSRKIKNLDKINPIKRDLIYTILSKIEGSKFLKRIVIFGSSIRDDCRQESDIDIAIEWTEDCYDEDAVLKDFTLPVYETISMETKGNNDVICIGYEGETIKSAIKEGVTVYE
jgi:predicted nucleotidyltransferase